MAGGNVFAIGFIALSIMVSTILCSISIPCPPSFIDMESFFPKTLQQNEQMRDMFNSFKVANSQINNCKYSWDILGNLDSFNDERCNQDEYAGTVCTTTTTTTTTQTPTRPSSPPTVKTSPNVVPPKWTSSSSSASSSSGPAMVTTSPPRPVPQPSTPEDKDMSTHDVDSTTKSVKIPDGNSIIDGHVGAKPVDNSTTIYISVGAGVLLIIVVVSLVVLCRTPSAASDGARKKRVQRQRSDLEPINSVQGDMSRRSSDGSCRYGREMPKGNKWRPDYSSANSSEHGSMKSSRFLLTREESRRKSIASAEFHFNTLNHLEHPNAIVLGGFGETSTDHTLGRNGTLPNGKFNGEVTVEVVGGDLAETKIDYDQPKLCGKDGYDNPAMSKSSSFDSVDRAIDDWKQSVEKEKSPTDDDLVNSQNDFMFSYENKAFDADLVDLNTPVATPNTANGAPKLPKDNVAETPNSLQQDLNTPVAATPNVTAHATPDRANDRKIVTPDHKVAIDTTPNSKIVTPDHKVVIDTTPNSKIVTPDHKVVIDNTPKVAMDVNATVPASNVAVVLPTKRLSVIEMKGMFERGNHDQQSNTLQPKRGTNGMLKNGVNTKFHSLPRNPEKPSAHVQPQPVISIDRDADVQL